MSQRRFKIGEICQLVRGTSPTLKTPSGMYPLVVTAEFRRTADTWQLEGPAVCVPLISSTGHGDAALHRVHYQEGKFALANLLVALLPSNPEICFAKYLYHLLMARKDELFVPLMLGTANVSLKERDIAEVEIPLPSLAEQRHIVARIEELAAQINEARALRNKSLQETEALAHATSERAFQQLAAQHGVSPIERFCTTVTDGDHNTPPFSEEGIRFIFVGNVSSGKLHFDSAKHVTSEYFHALKPQRVPKRGDILFSAVGATLGVPAVVDSDEPFCFQRHIAILKPDLQRLDSRFAWHMLKSRTAFSQAWASTTGSAQPTIPLKAIRALPIPAAPLAEQRRIVAELDALQAEVDALKRHQRDTAAELDALLPAILDRAFRGEL